MQKNKHSFLDYAEVWELQKGLERLREALLGKLKAIAINHNRCWIISNIALTFPVHSGWRSALIINILSQSGCHFILLMVYLVHLFWFWCVEAFMLNVINISLFSFIISAFSILAKKLYVK